ncbi:cobalt-precorrin-4/precorrin-4 C(11)-methyltransferase [Pseudomonas lini]
MTVYFIGAGPGDPELITVKGQRLIRSCPVIIYAGSLVPAAVLEGHRAEQVVNSAELHLEQIIELVKAAHANGQDVARVHSGDPSLYGAIGEQIRYLRELDIPFEIIPGVTATAACAALLGAELTLPDVSQSVILTRYADKTAMPAGEELGSLAQHGATMAIHLGGQSSGEDPRRIAAALRRRLPDSGDSSGNLAGSGLGGGDAGGYCREG